MHTRRRNHRELWRTRGFASFLVNLKRNPLWLRRLAFLWILILMLEFFCPVFDCPDENFLPTEPARQVLALDQPQSTDSTDQFSLSNKSKKFKQSINSLSPSSSEDDVQSISKGNSVHCADECLCHAVAIPSLAFKMPDSYVKPTFVAISYSDALTLALPPPFQPPKSA